MSMAIVAAMTKAPKGIKRDDDFIDRLSNRYTVAMIVGFSAILGFFQSWGTQKFMCWCPKHFTGSHCKYTSSFCWVRNTYHLPFAEEIPHPTDDEGRDYIIYYQWLPMILLGQAALFFAPSVIWHGLNQKSGVDADHILQSSGKYHKSEAKKADKQKTLSLIVYQMHRFLYSPKSARTGWQVKFKKCLNVICCHCFGARMGNYLTVLYMIVKLLYIANIIGQLYILNNLLKTNYAIFGVEFFQKMMNDYDYAYNSPVFPRVSMCDFNVRRLGNVQRYTVQCVLPLNLFAEKMYVFLWFWMVLVGVLSVVSLVQWMMRSLFRKDRLLFIRNQLRSLNRMDEPGAEELTAEFLDEYLKQDGAFLLRLIIHNTSHHCCADIMDALYTFWKDKVRKSKYLTETDDEDGDEEENNKLMA